MPYEIEQATYEGKAFGMGCPDRHGLVQAHPAAWSIGDNIRVHYEQLAQSIGPMIEAWNEQQEQKRVSQLFPGVVR